MKKSLPLTRKAHGETITFGRSLQPFGCTAFAADTHSGTLVGESSRALPTRLDAHHSFFWRIDMLPESNHPIQPHGPRRWGLAAVCTLLALAVVGAGVTLRAADEPKKDEAKPSPKKDEPKRRADDVLPDLDDLLKDLKGFDGDQAEMLQKQMERIREEMRRAMQGRLPEARFGLPGRLVRPERAPEGRLGAMVSRPSATLVEQLELPKDQGVIVEEVKDDSAAAKVGLKAHDIVLELNGKPAASEPAEFAKQVADVKTGSPVDVVILRKGKKETLKGLTLPEAKPAERGARFDLNALELPRRLGAVDRGVSMSVQRNNDQFTARRAERGLTITVTGTVANGKATVNEVQIENGRETKKYADLDKVPEEYRARAKDLADMAAGGGKPASPKAEF
jgi:hypothetical protein